MENTKTESESKAGKTGQIIRIEQEQLTKHLDKVVRDTVEETLNALLDAEADRLCQAHRYERTEKRQDTRAGHYKRSLATKAGPVELKVPKLRSLSFETAIIERYRRRESSVEEALIEMYLAGVSVRRVEDITKALWGTRVSPGTVSNLNKKVYDRIEKGSVKNFSHFLSAACQSGRFSLSHLHHAFCQSVHIQILPVAPFRA